VTFVQQKELTNYSDEKGPTSDAKTRCKKYLITEMKNKLKDK
jgi:hypothetical protein